MKRAICVLLILVLAGVLVWAGLIGMVWWKEKHVPAADNYDSIIVLGAQVQQDGTLSVQLQWRMDAAVEAYQKHPCRIVVCGAQGSDEPAPEAEVMRDYLIENGVSADDILTDPDSFNTKQNIRNAKKLLGDDAGTVLIVTSDYHLPRALALAEDEGMKAVGLGSPCKAQYWLKNHAREAISWVKYLFEKWTGR